MRSTLFFSLAALAAAVPAAAAPGDVNANDFLGKASAFKAKGPLALMSGDLKPMKAQMADAGKRVRAQNLAAKNDGKPLYCPPASRKGAGAGFVIETSPLSRKPAASK